MKVKISFLFFATFLLAFFYVPLQAQIISTVAGGGISSGVPATQVAVPVPADVALDAFGNLYIVSNAGSVRKVSPSGIITTVAGGGTGTLSDGGSATNGTLINPTSVAIDATGNIYITEFSANKIRKVNTSGIISTIAGTGAAGYNGDGIAATVAQLNLPTGIKIDPVGNILFADMFNQRIRKINTSGIITTLAGNGTGGYNGDGIAAISANLNFPLDVAIDTAGNIYIADNSNQRVRKVSTTGIITTVAGTGTPGFSGDGAAATSAQLNSPLGVTSDVSGNIFIACSGDSRIRKVSTIGIITTFAGTGVAGFSGDAGIATSAQLNAPWGMIVDALGNLFIADENNNRVRQINISGIISTIAGDGSKNVIGDGGPALNAILYSPTAVFVDRAGNIYFPDSNTVRKVDLSGTITTIAGTGVAGFSGDGGQAANAQLNHPFGIYVDPAGNIYIGSTGDNRIRKINTSGVISTFAGNGINGYSGDGGPATSASIAAIQGITSDGSGNIYFTDFFHGVVRKINSSGIISTFAGTGVQGYSGDGGLATSAQLGSPNGISIDAAGNFYIGDDAPVNVVRKINNLGIISTVAGGSASTGNTGDGGLATSALFADIESVYSDTSGNLYIVDAANFRIRRVDAATGIISPFAGIGTSGFSGDGGLATSAQFNNPWAIARDSSGNFYIGDAGNRRIRRISSPVVTPDSLANSKLGIRTFAIFAGDSTASLTDSVRYGVEIASWNGSNIQGNIGSNSFVQFTQTSPFVSSFPVFGNIYGNIVYAPGRVQINGNISVLNRNAVTYNVLNLSAASINSPGNIFVNGNAISNSAPAGVVHIPSNYTYTGPAPLGGIDNTPFVFHQMPDFPPVSNYTVPTGADITTTQTIVPGSYGNIMLSGGQTLTFSGVGTYVFASVVNTGANNFVYDFKNNATGAFQLIFTQNADVGNLNAQMLNGGSAARIFTEAKGLGTAANNFSAFSINTSGGSLGIWVGTVYAPYAAITGGNLDPQSVTLFTGCLWSTTKVKLGANIGFTYVPPAIVSQILPVSDIIPYYPPPADGKVNTVLGSELTSLYENAGALANDSIIYRIFGNQVLLEVIALQGHYTEALNFLLANGLNGIINNGPGSLIITGKFPIANLLLLNTRPDIFDYARPLYFPINNAGIAQNQGDSSMETNVVRKAYNLCGAGVKVGVMSDSYNTIPGNYAGIDVANGDLPGPANPYNHLTPVEVLGEYPYGQSIDEGRAMLQVVHDIAPGSPLAFRTAFLTANDFALGIGQLRSAGCKVIVDDVTFITEPYFKDGVVARAVDAAVATGTSYFSAAGNFGKKSYEGTFSGIPAPASLSGITGLVHNFGAGNPLQTINLQPGNYTIVLQWDDNIYSLDGTTTGAQTDLDIYVVDNFGTTLFGFNRNNLGGDPLEVLPFRVTSPTTASLLIAKAAGPDVHFKYIVFRGNLAIAGFDGSSTLVGQANSAGAIAVGAALYTNTAPYGVDPPTIASFSSRGGTIVEGTLRNKPDLTAPNGVNTTVNFNSVDYEPDGFPNFFGTSAAAPNAAAAAALLIEGQQKFLAHIITPAEIKGLLQSTATDMATPGYDTETGFGFIQPMKAMLTFANPKPLIIGLETASPVVRPVTSSFTVNVRGKFLTPQTKVYLRGVPLTTTFISSNIVSAVIPAFSDNPPVTLYNPPITSGALDGGLSDTLYFFPKKHVVIKAVDTTKKYGEKIPVFTSTITVDGVPIANTSLIPSRLKLDSVQYKTPATSSSNIASYFIHPYIAFDPTNPDDALLLDTYTYEFIDGLLTVTKLPLNIRPRDSILTYGQKIHGIGFIYTIDALTSIQNPDSLVNAIHISHASAIVDSIFALANGSGTTSRSIINHDVDSLGILISNGSGTTSRALVNNGSGTTDTSYVVDISNESIFNYEADPASSPLVNGSGTTSRALVNTGPLVNGTASVLINGSGTTSRSLVNGDPLLLNSTTTGSTSISNIAVVVSSADVPSATGNHIFTHPVNLVTGITAGDHFIVPAAFISANFKISYGLGKLTIKKFPLNITANTTYTNNGILPLPFTSTINSYQYQDATTMNISGPSYTLRSVITGEIVTFNGTAGVYLIRPSGLNISGDSNYAKSYIDGMLYVNPYGSSAKKVVLQLKCVEALTVKNLTGYKYVAHFSYENKNATPVYVPIGSDNKITSSKPFGGVQPTVFLPGVNYVDFYFDGQKLTWDLKTNEGSSKKSVSEASVNSSSPKCKAIASAVNEVNNIYEKPAVPAKLYPNPAGSSLWIVSNGFSDKQKSITIISVAGINYQAKIKSQLLNTVEIDIADLPKGVYFIRIKDKDQVSTLKFIKL